MPDFERISSFRTHCLFFPDIPHRALFSVNVYGSHRNEPQFDHIANIFVPFTVDACYEHSGDGPVPGIKTDKGVWAVAGHLRRIVRVSPQELSIFAQSLDTEGTSAVEARLPALHSTELMAVMRKFADQPRRLRDLERGVLMSANPGRDRFSARWHHQARDTLSVRHR